MELELWQWIALGAGGALLLLVVGGLVRIRRRRAALKETFGHEYHRAVAEAGTGDAERRLADVEREHEDLDLRPLPPAARERYLEEWRQAEARFVSDPREAARSAARILERVLEERGYPRETDSGRRVAFVAVDYPSVAERYREGQELLDRVDGPESTESLRRAMVDLRLVLEELVEATPATAGDRA